MESESASVILIAHNLRSIYNVGAILRTCDGLGITRFIATGTTPYPNASDTHLPHAVRRINSQIHKTALGAEESVNITHSDIHETISRLKELGYEVVALEQSEDSVNLRDYKAKNKLAMIVGNETEGIENAVLREADEVLEINMKGAKESLNVASATAIALWQLTN